jgi:hypothetical protein
MPMTARKLKRLLRFYAPYLGAGVRVTHIADDFLTAHVINILGPDYIVWDKSAAIRFKRPGKGTVKAVFEIPAERVAEIKAAADSMGKVEPQFQVLVMDEEGQIVAEIDKLLYVRRKMQDKKSQ